MDALHRYACSKLTTKTAVVREWIESLPNASSNPATPAKAAAATTDAPVLPQAQGDSNSIGFQPVARRPLNPAFAEQLRAAAARCTAL